MVSDSGARAPLVSKVLLGTLACVVFACDEPPAQDPSSQTDVTYQNGYAQTTPRAPGPAATSTAAPTTAPVTYTTAPAATSPVPASTIATAQPQPQPASAAATQPPMQTTPVPVGVQALPPPATPAAPGPSVTVGAPVPGATPAGAAPRSMAVPGPGAFQCTSDSQCLLGRCNTLYGRCAYPCKNSEIDCKPNNVCSAAGLCMPRVAGGVGM